MKLTIVYDNEVAKKGIGLKSDWGFACLIQTNKDTILFDTGAKGEILLNNMEKLNINPKDINKIVISHEHWDHNGGLKSVINFIDNAEVYQLSKDDLGGKIKLVDTKESTMVSSGVYTIGMLAGKPVDEHSLVLKSQEGWYVLAGCSHPSVDKILEASRKIGDVVGIIGGFHGFDNFSILDNLKFICPCHCTKYKKEIRKKFSKTSCECGVGKTIEII